MFRVSKASRARPEPRGHRVFKESKGTLAQAVHPVQPGRILLCLVLLARQVRLAPVDPVGQRALLAQLVHQGHLGLLVRRESLGRPALVGQPPRCPVRLGRLVPRGQVEHRESRAFRVSKA